MDQEKKSNFNDDILNDFPTDNCIPNNSPASEEEALNQIRLDNVGIMDLVNHELLLLVENENEYSSETTSEQSMANNAFNEELENTGRDQEQPQTSSALAPIHPTPTRTVQLQLHAGKSQCEICKDYYKSGVGFKVHLNACKRNRTKKLRVETRKHTLITKQNKK